MPVTWHYKLAGNEIGPISSPGLRRLAGGGIIEPSTPVRTSGATEWITAGEVAGLFAIPEDTRGDWRGQAAVQGPHFPASSETAPSARGSDPPADHTPGPRYSRRFQVRWALIAMLPPLAIAAALLALRRQAVEPSGVPAVAVATAAPQGPLSPAASPASPDSANERNRESKTESVKRGPPPVPAVGQKMPPEADVAPPAAQAATQPPTPAPADRASKQVAVPPDHAAPRALPAERSQSAPPRPVNNDAPATPSPSIAIAEAKSDSKILDARLSRLERIFHEVTAAKERLTPVKNALNEYQDTMNGLTLQKANLDGMLVKAEQAARNLLATKRQFQFSGNASNQKQAIVALNTQFKACMAQAEGLRQQVRLKEKEITELAAKLNAAQLRVAELSSPLSAELKEEWCWLCDPFGKYDKASHERSARLFTRWIDEAPDFAPAYLARSFSNLYAKQYLEALADLEGTRKFDETLSTLVLACRCLVLARSGQEQEALVEHRKLGKPEGKAAIVNLVIGHALLACDRPKDAYQHFKLALKSGARIPWVHEQMALFLATQDRIEPHGARLAIDRARKACELTDWQDWSCLDTLAVACAAAEDYKTAIGYADKALQQAPAACRPAVEARRDAFKKEKRYLPGK